MTPRRPILALALALAAAAAAPAPARAQTRADAFAGKIPPISGQLYRKAGRVELALTGDLSLADPFFTKYFGGVKLGYHFTDAWSAAVLVSGGTAVKSGSAVLCTSTAGCTDASGAMLDQVPGHVRGIAGAEIAWSPVYAKLNVLAEKVAHIDLSVLAGGDVVARDEILSKQAALDLAARGGSPALVMTPGWHVGLGTRIFLTEWMAATLDVKDVMYFVQVPNAGSGNDLQHQFFTQLGLSFFLPVHNRPTR